MWLPARTANQKLNENAQKQDADDIQALSVLYMTQSDAISQLYYISLDGGAQSPQPIVSV